MQYITMCMLTNPWRVLKAIDDALKAPKIPTFLGFFLAPEKFPYIIRRLRRCYVVGATVKFSRVYSQHVLLCSSNAIWSRLLYF